MAPANSPPEKKKQQREDQYFDIGVQGRKTGITVRDTGVRDEYGLEPLDGIFSSPEKSPDKEPTLRRRADATLTTSEDMDLQESSAPDPEETLTARKLVHNRKTIFPPPRSRSPIKTALGSSPRRQSSMGPQSALRRSTASPARIEKHPDVARRLDFGTIGEEEADESETEITDARSSRLNGGRVVPRRDVYDLPVSPVRGQKRTHEESFEEEPTANGEDHFEQDEGEQDQGVPDFGDDDETTRMQNGEEDHEQEADEQDASELPSAIPPTKRRGRKRKSDVVETAQATSHAASKSSAQSADAAPAPRRRGRPPKQAVQRDEDNDSIDVVAAPEPVKKRKGRQLKSAQAPRAPPPQDDDTTEVVDREEEDEDEAEEEPAPEPEAAPAKPPGKRRGRPPKVDKAKAVEPPKPKQSQEKKAKPQAAEMMPPPPKRAKPGPKPKNAKPEPSSQADRTSRVRDSSVMSAISGFKRLGSTVNAFTYRQETPMEDQGAYRSRSGRHVVKPVAGWKGEKIEYSHDGSKKDIIRAEELPAVKMPRAKSTAPRAKHKRRLDVIEEEEEEAELEEWEAGEGILQGYVTAWDDIAGMATEEDVLQDIAFAHKALETREVANSNFKFAKVLGLPFFSAGLVDLPPGSFKRSKNSRRMHMAFFVATGKVNVDVGGSSFTINRGGVWQVPRGNFYSIENRGEKPARIFFAQACELLPEEDAQ